jgi:hypothetical protein
VAITKEKKNACGVLVGRHVGKDLLEDLGIDGKIILKCVLKQ